jgi:hypothetical protein
MLRAYRPLIFVVLTAIVSGSAAACINPLTALPKLYDARRLASELRVSFTKAADASNRAVMADTDDASVAARDEALKARQVVDRDLDALQSVLHDLGYADELRYLAGFRTRYTEYRRLDDEILPLAIENSNLKAQRLSFGPAQEAAKAFRAALEGAVRAASPARMREAELLAARADIALLEIQVIHAAHIAESDDAAMTRMEARMSASGTAARKALEQLKATLPRAAAPQLELADGALSKFLTVNAQIVALSRRNTNVRSLALSLGRKRAVTAECQDQLTGLGEALARHDSRATR